MSSAHAGQRRAARRTADPQLQIGRGSAEWDASSEKLIGQQNHPDIGQWLLFDKDGDKSPDGVIRGRVPLHERDGACIRSIRCLEMKGRRTSA